jgi:aminoglycoside 6'-N-acetyltransferase I
MTIRVRPAIPTDAADWLRMRNALWPDDGDDHAREIEQFFAGRLRMPLAILLAIDDEDRVVGFAELSIRSYAEDCVTDRVAYLEGWYVAPEFRRRGVGKALIVASEEWGRSQGCREFGSDAVIDNATSAAAHLALGFEETVQLRCFRKVLVASPKSD